MRPIRLHLDTSDYSAMNDAQLGSPVAEVRQYLKNSVLSGSIEIGLSYHVVFELLQGADRSHRENRLSRARLLTELCGQNAFPYPTDMGAGHRFSKQGFWQPRITLEDHEIEVIVDHFIRAIQDAPESPRHLRRIVKKRKYLRRWAEDHPEEFSAVAVRNWPVMFGRTFVQDGIFGRYVAGAISRDAANAELWRFINDPESVYKLWFEECEWQSPILDRRNNIANQLVVMLTHLQENLSGLDDLRGQIRLAGEDALSSIDRAQLNQLRKDVKTFRDETLSARRLFEQDSAWKKLFGDESALLAAEIFFAFQQERRPIKPSDGIDFVHAMYLPHADLWRGDRAFSDLLRKHRVTFSERVVSTLAELPARIEQERVSRELD